MERKVSVERVSALSRGIFPLSKEEFIDLNQALLLLREKFNCRQCWFDENFKGARLIVKVEGVSFSVFANGKVMVYGLFSIEEIEDFLFVFWTDFFKKSVKNKHINL